MLCLLLLLPPLPGPGRIVVVCGEDACSMKNVKNPSLSSSPYLPHVSLYPPTKKEAAETKQRVYLPPRLCNLNEFGTMRTPSERPLHDDIHSGFFASLSAIIDLSAQVQNWEVLSGRLAMTVFASALMLEALTGNSVFEKMESHRLLEYVGATLVSILVAAGFAVALQAKSRVAYSVSKGYEKLINGFIDNVVDSLLFDDEDC